MKKILFTLISFSIIASVNAQDAADKTFQGGLVFAAGMNFQKMGTGNIDKNGAGSDLTIGGNMNFMFTETIGLTTGVEFDFNTTKYKPGTSTLYYLYNDKNINEINDDIFTDEKVNTDGKSIFQLNERKQKAVYLTVPTMLLFRTNFIGYMRYFGKFGLRNSFILSQKTNDIGYNVDPVTMNQLNASSGTINNTGFKAKNEMFFFKSAVGIAGGAEWNFVGTTCLVAEIGYYYGFMPLYYDRNSPYLFTSGLTNGTSSVGDPNGTDYRISNKATQQQLQLKVSILF